MLRVKVDAQGRMVLPRSVRRLLHIDGQVAELELEETPDGVLLEAPRPRAVVEQGDDGLPVVSIGSGPGSIRNDDVVEAIAEERAGR